MNFFNGSGHGLFESDQVDLQKKSSQVMGQPVFASSQKNRVQIRYFSSWVRKS